MIHIRSFVIGWCACLAGQLLAWILGIGGLGPIHVFTSLMAMAITLVTWRWLRKKREERAEEWAPEPDDYLSYGEVERTPGCNCRPSNVLYWELSPAITDDCPIHGPG